MAGCRNLGGGQRKWEQSQRNAVEVEWEYGDKRGTLRRKEANGSTREEEERNA